MAQPPIEMIGPYAYGSYTCLQPRCFVDGRSITPRKNKKLSCCCDSRSYTAYDVR